MRILQVVPFEESVPPTKYGGVELVVYNLVEELVNRGHEVYLSASGDSKTSAKLLPFGKKALRNAYRGEELDQARIYSKFRYPFHVVEQIHKIKPDVVHNHYAWRILSSAKLHSATMLTTMHGPMASKYEQKIYEEFSHLPFVSISDNQRKAMPYVNWVKTVYNGIDPNMFRLGEKSERDYFAFLGRTSPEKGLLEICKIIKSTNQKLKIAAKVDRVDKNYFESKIKPLIDGKQIEFIGEIGGKEKKEFLAKAKALLLWLNWEEPFGLVVTEAMASGTPVIVNRRGSMPELIDNQKTGFLINNLSEMKNCLDKVEKINAETCRNHVIKNFSVKSMTDGYEELLESIAYDSSTKSKSNKTGSRYRRHTLADSAILSGSDSQSLSASI